MPQGLSPVGLPFWRPKSDMLQVTVVSKVKAIKALSHRLKGPPHTSINKEKRGGKFTKPACSLRNIKSKWFLNPKFLRELSLKKEALAGSGGLCWCSSGLQPQGSLLATRFMQLESRGLGSQVQPLPECPSNTQPVSWRKLCLCP